MAIKDIVNEIVELKKQEKIIKSEINKKNTELQEQCIAVFEDKNIKTTEVYGNNNNSAIATYSQKLEILNYQAYIIDKNLLAQKIERKQEIKYDIESNFKDAIIILYTNDYINNMTIEELVKNEFGQLDTKVQSLLIKKIKRRL